MEKQNNTQTLKIFNSRFIISRTSSCGNSRQWCQINKRWTNRGASKNQIGSSCSSTSIHAPVFCGDFLMLHDASGSIKMMPPEAFSTLKNFFSPSWGFSCSANTYLPSRVFSFNLKVNPFEDVHNSKNRPFVNRSHFSQLLGMFFWKWGPVLNERDFPNVTNRK